MRKRAIIFGAIVVIGCTIAGVLATTTRTTVPEHDQIPLARARRGNLDLRVHAIGDLRAVRSLVLTAPPVAGGALQITRLLRTGSPVKKGEIVFEFDPAEQFYKLEQSRSELLQADQEIAKAKADAAVQAAQDKIALLKARFEMRRAELEVQKNELVSTIEAKKNDLSLKQAQAVLAKLKQDVESHTASGTATVLLAREKRNKAKLAMEQARQNIQKMRVTAPMDGLVAIEKNSNAMGDMMWQGMTLPDYRTGDKVEPGSAIAEVIDPIEMELIAKIGEEDRGNVEAGGLAEIEFEALPGRIFHGTIKTVGGMSNREFWEANTEGKFDVTIEISKRDGRLRPGLTAQVVVAGAQKKGVVYIPRQALFMKEGKRVVYLKNGKGFEQREVKVQCETESRAAIDGLKAGNEIGLLDPTVPRAANSNPTTDLGDVTR
jgi:HlyD family secretion protein